MFDTVAIKDGNKLSITLDTECSPMCRIGEKHFLAMIAVTYIPADLCMEFVSFEAWIRTFNGSSTTIEELCNSIYDGAKSTLEPAVLTVAIKATTTVHGRVAVSRKE